MRVILQVTVFVVSGLAILIAAVLVMRKKPRKMRVLDLDLDFFADCICQAPAFSEERLSSDECEPWSESIVREFLEDRCGLSRERPVRGCVVKHHHEALSVWKELIDTEQISGGLEVTHVDAHADLGITDPGREYLLTDVLHRDVQDRRELEIAEDRLNPENYLLFAIANRWISRLTFVPNHKWSWTHHDLPNVHFKHGDVNSGAIQLQIVAAENFNDWLFEGGSPVGFEPEVPFSVKVASKFRSTGDFDFIVLAKSPGFTTEASDNLIPVIREYIEDECV